VLTRLKVSGFKNLKDVDVRLGPFTCLAGANGSGKSNLLDAVAFLGALADRPLLDAARSLRDDAQGGDARDIFSRGPSGAVDTVRLEAEMVIPTRGTDDLGQPATATVNFLRYAVTIRRSSSDLGMPCLELVGEELGYIRKGDARENLGFPCQRAFLDSVLHGRRTTPFISTTEGPDRAIKLHADGNVGGVLRTFPATLPRTVLSTVNGADNPTALLARREMQSWQRLRLEPGALRRVDTFTAPPRMGADGSHLPAVLQRLVGGTGEVHRARGGRITHRLSTLSSQVRGVYVDRDDQRELLTVMVAQMDGVLHPARELSDGTLRFLALCALAEDPLAQGMVCVEEPENGIHPERIRALMALLEDLAVDGSLPVGEDNPLRQVVVTTHAPAVLGLVDDQSVVFATAGTADPGGPAEERGAAFLPLAGSWRARLNPEGPVIAKDGLVAYLTALPRAESVPPLKWSRKDADPPASPRRRVIERPECGQLALGLDVAPKPERG
jgi:predicted ATPase